MASTLQESSKLSQFTINGGDWSASSPNLQKNLSVLSPEQVHLAKMLLDMGQSHLFEHWPEPGVDDDEKKSFFNQVNLLNSSYPGGLASYIQNARKLLADSKAGKNPFEGFTPSSNLAKLRGCSSASSAHQA
ncbi:hypothetical protein Scep_002528 [Stephania cephalantha]|uniref:Uncharacterized protein n=1 Tax=Stephania cephalantha TaxID=152367 RepID=A0AAP0LA28_9MAGN